MGKAMIVIVKLGFGIVTTPTALAPETMHVAPTLDGYTLHVAGPHSVRGRMPWAHEALSKGLPEITAKGKL